MVRTPLVTITSLTATGTPAERARILAARDAVRPRAARPPCARSGREVQVGVGLRILGFGEAQRLGGQFGGAERARKQGLPHAVDGQGGMSMRV